MNLFKLYTCLICDTPCYQQVCLPCWEDLPWVPHHCLQCNRAAKQPHSYCLPCQKQLSPFIYQVPLLYERPVKQIITAFKLNKREALCLALAELFLSRQQGTLPDVLIPVPAHPKRIWERGYNPPLLIARHLSRALGIPVDDKAIRRCKYTPPQRLQRRQERMHNLKNAFEVVKLKPGLHIAIVDDVVTTGETLRAMAEVITPHVKSVVLWAIAESPAI